MGGYGSGRWRSHIKRRLVDDSVQIDSDDLVRAGCITPWGSGQITLRTATGHPLGKIPFHVVPVEGKRLILTFVIPVGGKSERQAIPLAAPVAFAGRWAFECPVSKGDDLPHCSARCRKLYVPPGERNFACRSCHRLTYHSTQSRDPRVERLRRNPELLDEVTHRLLAEARTGQPRMRELVRLMRALSLTIRDEISALRRTA